MDIQQMTTPLIGTVAIGSFAFAVLPPGYTIEYFDHLLPAPFRSVGNTDLQDVDSFIQFVNQEWTDNSRIYCNKERGGFLAVFNDNFMDQPGWRDHTASFHCPIPDIDQVRANVEEGTGHQILNGSI